MPIIGGYWTKVAKCEHTQQDAECDARHAVDAHHYLASTCHSDLDASSHVSPTDAF